MEIKLTKTETRHIQAIGTCEICGEKNVVLKRTYFYYGEIRCKCHSLFHYDLIDHCSSCIPKQPKETKIILKVK